MSAALIAVAGTGTGIGKTLVSCALVRAWSDRGAKVVGLKPIETGVTPGATGADGGRLEHLSTFHVKRFPAPYLFERPVSPHLAARDRGVTIDFATVAAWAAPFREEADGVVIESAGGLFSPLTDDTTNADLLASLHPTTTVLVAVDRLGVLHDVGATLRAAAAQGIAIREIVLSAPEVPDASTGTNADELRRTAAHLARVPISITPLPRCALEEAARHLDGILARLPLSAASTPTT